MTSSFDWDTFYSASLVSSGLADPDEFPSVPDEPGPDQRWSTWPQTAHTMDRGPQPFPDWVVQHDGAIDTELGVLKTGKEADAFLLERALPEHRRTGAPGERALYVAKRYRSEKHSSFHRTAQYTEGRRVKDSREARAIAKGTAFGREAAADRWARAEFDVLTRLSAAGLPVPYPVQVQGTELLMEFVGTEHATDGTPGTPTAGARLHEARPEPDLADRWAAQLRRVVVTLGEELGLVHGDLSPYNVLVDPRSGGQDLVVIDVPQVLDLVANPHGEEFLRRDCRNVCTWLGAHGADPRLVDAEEWVAAALPRAR
ncbi:phosphotransferase [Brachybacterium rhamnosum]|uniref:non-specific serine/threonine protein kinase n=1 Tax=Brachybacterium rhamnosum TaxID=173361 RepID=A0ABW4PX97_9MICO